MGKVMVDIIINVIVGMRKLNFPGVLFGTTAMRLVTTFEHT